MKKKNKNIYIFGEKVTSDKHRLYLMYSQIQRTCPVAAYDPHVQRVLKSVEKGKL